MVQNFFKAFLIAPLALLIEPTEARNELPADHQVLTQHGHATQKALPSQFRLLVWNIHKAEDGVSWQRDFHQLAFQSDLILLQEGYEIPAFAEVTSQLPDVLWSFAKSFIYEGKATGVVTGAATQPVKTEWLRSPGREPIIKTPKMTLFSEFDLPQRDDNLLVANIHAINFVSNTVFYEHITQVVKHLSSHRGPIIFAGDFNTWNPYRLNYLSQQMTQLGLSPVSYQNDSRKLPLDHVFYRGIKPQTTKILDTIKSSDHYPLVVEFSTDLP